MLILFLKTFTERIAKAMTESIDAKYGKNFIANLFKEKIFITDFSNIKNKGGVH